jgi:hypothetical protein
MTKELVIVAGDIKGAVEICETDTLEDVRALILEEFDDDMLPFEYFCFHVNDIRISEKQERKKQVWSLSTVSLHSKSKQGTKRKLESSSTHEQPQSTSKRGRSDDENRKETPASKLASVCFSIEHHAVKAKNASNASQATQANGSSTNNISSVTKIASFDSCEQQQQQQQEQPVNSEEESEKEKFPTKRRSRAGKRRSRVSDLYAEHPFAFKESEEEAGEDDEDDYPNRKRKAARYSKGQSGKSTIPVFVCNCILYILRFVATV